MKETNIISLLNAHTSLPIDTFKSYVNYFAINIKEDELSDLNIFYNHLKSLTLNVELFDNYFIGFSIPQIGKEFDLLRFGNKSIINIELKREGCTEKILNQLKRNKYYLSFLNREKIYLFSYISSSKKLYTLDIDNNLIESKPKNLIKKLIDQDVIKLDNINNYFNPSNYLVSPFNSTKKFIKGKYFLTIHQEKIKNAILKELRITNYSILSTKGKAGTGKTLLIYDLAKEIINSKNIIIIHCGILNNGHKILQKDHNWDIISAKNIFSQDYSTYHLIIVDEAQRIRKQQLDHLIKNTISNSINCIFSYDAIQTLRSQEIKANISAQIEKKLTKNPFELTTKIRTNKEVAQFIKCLFNIDEIIHKMDFSKIKLNYFNNHSDAKKYLIQLTSKNWKIINYTPDSRTDLPYEKNNIKNIQDNAHTVVGQEFDNVIAVIDEHFYYKEKKLSTQNYDRSPYYHPTKMLYQIVSRTRIKLGVIIINNPMILNRCLEILSKNTKQ